MRSKLIISTVSLLASASARAGAPPAGPDIEVVGRLENLNYESITDPDDVIGHGWITARLHISRVLRGRPTSRVITIRYFAHTYWNDQISRRFRLRPRADGVYLACVPPGQEGVQCR